MTVLVAPEAALSRPQAALALTSVLDRAAGLRAEFQAPVLGIVTEEITSRTWTSFTRFKPEVMHRELKSDLLLVRPEDVEPLRRVPGRGGSGRPRRPRSAGSVDEALSRTHEVRRSAAENHRRRARVTTSGKCMRNVNTPTIGAGVSRSGVQVAIHVHRLPTIARLPLRGARERRGTRHRRIFRCATEVWVVEYRGGGTDGRSSDARRPRHAGTGAVLARARHRPLADDRAHRRRLGVASHDQRQLSVGTAARLLRAAWRCANATTRPISIISGTANYRNFRQFDVKVEENISPGKF